MKGWQQPAERFPGMPRPPRKERSGAGIVVVPDKENTFQPQNQLPSFDNRKSTVEDYDEHSAERAPTIAPLLSPAERMAARLLEARRRGIQGLVLVSSRDDDDIVPSSGLPRTRKEIEVDHQKLDETIGVDVDPIRLDNDAAAKALSAADEELRKFFYPQMLSTDLPASSPIETAETISIPTLTSPPVEEALTSDTGSLVTPIIVPPSDLLRIADASSCDEETDQELQELRGGAAPSNDPEGFLVKVFSPVAEEVELLLNTESNDQLVALSQVSSIDESTGVMKTAPSADTVKSHPSADTVKSHPSADTVKSHPSADTVKSHPSADTVKSLDEAGVEVAELLEVNGSDETVVVINTSLSNCAKISTDQSSTNESTSEEDEDLEDQDTWSAGTPRNDTNCFAEVFSPLAEEVMLLINPGAKKEIPALPEGDEIEEPNAIPTIMPSADGPVPQSGDQSSMHANEESVKMAVLSDTALAAPANHDLPNTEEIDLHTASKTGGLCCFAGPVNMLVDDELAALIDGTEDVASHVTAQVAPNSTVAPNVVEKKATSTLLACPDSSDEKCAEEMEGVAQSPCSVSTLDGHIDISDEDKVEATSALKEETFEPAIENDESNPKDTTTSSTCEALELKTAHTAINDQAQDIESITSTEAATSALKGEPTSEPASEHIAPARESMELITTGNVIDDQVQDAELDASTEAPVSALLEETTQKATEHGGPSPEDITTVSTSETTSTSSKLDMATAVKVIDEQQPLDVESAAPVEEATPSALGEVMKLEEPIELGEPIVNEVNTILTSNPPKVATASSSINDHAQDAESDTSKLREERYVETAIQHGSPAPEEGTTTSVSMTLEVSTTGSVIDDQTEDASLRGEVTIESAFDSGESKQVSTRKTHDVATAGSFIDEDVEFDTSTVAATSGLQEKKNFETATEHRELKSSDITFSSTITTLEAATTGAVIDNQAQVADSDTSIGQATSAQRDEREVKETIEHGASAPNDITTRSSSTALEISLAAGVIDDEAHDVESDTSTEAATSSLTEEDTLKPAIEHEGSKANSITTSPANKTPEMAAAAAAMRRSARRRLRNLNINRSRHSVSEGREDNGKVN